MTAIRQALRPEAGPIRHDSLNRSQRDALTAIVATLSQAVSEAARSNPSVDPHGVDRAIDTDRVSRLFFVSGEPGSGKSSLYATLRAIVGNDSRHADIRREYRDKLAFSDLEGKTRWLEPIDLEVVGDEGENFLAAVLVRISEAIDDALNHSVLSGSKQCRDALHELEVLANDIGIAWDGNLKARAGSLDPDSYSQETIRTQRARLRVNSRLRYILDKFLTNRCHGISNEELFVLPIDDFYLNPKVSLELLRLLRMISVPRLFFLIMGDIKAVEALFLEKALADWTAVAGPQVFATRPAPAKEDVHARVREMRARYLRKLIPAGQRATINWTEWDQALRSAPPPTILNSAGGEPLCDLLSNVPVFWRDEPSERDRNLLNYLVSPALDKDTRCDTTGNLALPDPDTGRRDAVNEFREAYSGLQVLDATPREILDLWIQLQEFRSKRVQSGGDGRDDDYLRMLLQYALAAIEEQDFLTEENQEILRFVFPRSDRDDLQLGTDRLCVAQKYSPWRRSPDNNILVRRHLDWKLGIREPGQEGRNQVDRRDDRHLPPRKAAWVILLHDLVWNWKPDSVLENLVQRLLGEVRDSSIWSESTTVLGTMHPGWAWYMKEDRAPSGKEKKGHWVHFPLPKVDTFRQLDRFLAIWSHKLIEHLKNVESAHGDNAAWRTVVAQRWKRAAWIATGPEDRYATFALSPDHGADVTSAEWNVLFRDDQVFRDWIAWSD